MALETGDQRVLAGKLRTARPRLIYSAIPLGGHRRGSTRSALAAEGVIPGVPDLLIFTPPPCGGYVGTALELKREKAPPSSWKAHQRRWGDELLALGWYAGCEWGLGNALRRLRSLGYAI